MSDDVETCGFVLDSGDPCQLPASRPDGRCHHHTDTADGNSGGHPSKYTEDRARQAIDAARQGFSKAGCARAAGVGEATLRRWLEANHSVDGDDFRRTFTRARFEGEKRLVTGPLVDSDDPTVPDIDGQHARFLLSTSFEYEKTEKRELSTPDDEDGFGTTIVLDSEYVDE